MDFSQNIPGVKNTVYSPNSQLIAVTNGTKIIVKSVENLNNQISLEMKEIVSLMKFSPDSTLLLVVMQKISKVLVYTVSDGKKLAEILDEGSGIMYARFSPDSRSLITFSDYQLKATIYSFVDKSVYYIKSPKFTNKGIAFSSNGKFMAIAERKDAQDYIGIYFTSDWKLINHFKSDTKDLQDLLWSSDNSYILVWDTPINYNLIAYCPAQGKKATISPYQYALGIKSVSVSKSSTFVTVGSYDEKIRLINALTWQIITEFEHKSNLKYPNQDQPIIYNEEYNQGNQYQGQNNTTFYSNPDTIKIPTLKVDYKKPDQPQGIEKVIWSYDNNFIASKSSNMPNTIWIWDLTSLELKFVLNHVNPVKSFVWNTNSAVLAISTGKSKLFFFSPDGASVCDLPFEGGKPFCVNKLQWSEDSRSMVLGDDNQIIVGYPPQYLTGIEDENEDVDEDEQQENLNNQNDEIQTSNVDQQNSSNNQYNQQQNNNEYINNNDQNEDDENPDM